MVIEEDVKEILIACENGYGKRTPVEEFNAQNRGGGGVIAIKTSERNGALVRATKVHPEDDIILISNKGTLVRTPVAQVATSGRNTQGVTLIRLAHDEALVAMARVEDSGEEDEIVEAMKDEGLLADEAIEGLEDQPDLDEAEDSLEDDQ